MRVAVASSDGKVVNQHFGRATRFLIFELERDGEFKYITTRENVPPCSGGEHDPGLLNNTVNLLLDCQAVLVSQIGPGAEKLLLAKGIKAMQRPNFIEAALRYYSRHRK